MSAPTQQASPTTTPNPSPPINDSQALQLALEQTKQQLATMEREKRESDLLSSVVFTHDGLESSNLGGLWRLATMYSRSSIVPDHYQGKPENCLIALQMAQRCKVDPFAFMQSSYMVHGKPGLEGKLAIAMLNSSGKIVGRIRYEFAGEGEKRSCTAIVKDKETGEDIRMTITWAMVLAEGWNLPKGKGEYKQPSKWTTIPDQMFRYRSATFLIRAHYPEVLMGLRTTDELEEEETTPPPAPPTGRVDLRDKPNGSGNGHHQEPVTSEAPEDPPPHVPGGDADPEKEESEQPTEDLDATDRQALADQYQSRLERSDTGLDLSALLAEVEGDKEPLGEHYERLAQSIIEKKTRGQEAPPRGRRPQKV